jgi:hypothetical protein
MSAFVLRFGLLIASFVLPAYAQPEDLPPLDLSYDEHVVSMVRVLAVPERYDGKTVTITGYYHLEEHLSALFLDRDSCLGTSTENSVLTTPSMSLPKDRSGYRHCERIEVSGELKHDRKYYSWRSKTDVLLKNAEYYGPR